jgi:hypothetical protein
MHALDAQCDPAASQQLPTAQQIAAVLSVAVSTVRAHLLHLYWKLDILDGPGRRAPLACKASALPKELAARYRVTDFVATELPDVLALADVAVSRSGAGTIAELTALGKAAVFIPLASSAGGEQRCRQVRSAPLSRRCSPTPDCGDAWPSGPVPWAGRTPHSGLSRSCWTRPATARRCEGGHGAGDQSRAGGERRVGVPEGVGHVPAVQVES